MTEINKWFDRKFKLDLPLALYPNVVERLRGASPRLEEHLLNLPVEVLIRKSGEDWSIQEHAGHLLDLESLEMGRLDDYEAGLPELRPADLQNRKTFEANHNNQAIQAILSQFRSERFALVQRLLTYDIEFIKRSAIHPRLQLSMRVIDLAYFTAEHDDHHITTISRMIENSREK